MEIGNAVIYIDENGQEHKGTITNISSTEIGQKHPTISLTYTRKDGSTANMHSIKTTGIITAYDKKICYYVLPKKN